MNKFILYLFLTIFILSFSSCSSKSENAKLKDFHIYKQDANAYTKDVPIFSKQLQNKLDEKFNRLYFKPWHIKKLSASLKEASWGNVYAKKKVYGENHKLLSKDWFDKQIKNSNFERYNTFLRKAITIRNSNLRVFPTNHKIFYNPKKAGEGFPFDYNQNSGIKINSPILISHFSQDRAWVYITSSFASGWIKVDDIAYVDKNIIDIFENGNYYVAIRDKFPIYIKGIFVEYIKLGTIFPVTKNNQALVIGKYQNLNGFLRTVNIEDIFIEKKPIAFNSENISSIINQLIDEPYGWGELLTNRDCSSLTRDYMAPFGIYLSRNSKAQASNGKYINMSKMSKKEKKELIIKEGKPFLTLLYMRGHIMLYVGQKEKEPLAFHNVWGLKTKDSNGKEGRRIIGKAVITSLEVGKELDNINESKSLLNRLEGMTILNQSKK